MSARGAVPSVALIRKLIAEECARWAITPELVLSGEHRPAAVQVRAAVIFRLRAAHTLPSQKQASVWVAVCWYLPADEIEALVAEECVRATVTPDLVLSRDHRAACSWVRARVIKRLYAMERFSLPGIGRAFGLDHSTIIHAVQRRLSEAPPSLKPREHELPKALNEQTRRRLLAPRAPQPAPQLPPSSIPPVPLARRMAGRA